MCRNLKEIKIPLNVQEIGSFSLGSTSISKLLIPNNVTKINPTAFESSPIEEFEVEPANVVYKTIDGILVSSSGALVKYPEGKLDTEYTTDDFITSLGPYSIRHTNLKTLTLGDNVVSHSDESISTNPYLDTINIGSNFNPNKISRNIYRNVSLMNVNVSDEHATLSSINGVV